VDRLIRFDALASGRRSKPIGKIFKATTQVVQFAWARVGASQQHMAARGAQRAASRLTGCRFRHSGVEFAPTASERLDWGGGNRATFAPATPTPAVNLGLLARKIQRQIGALLAGRQPEPLNESNQPEGDGWPRPPTRAWPVQPPVQRSPLASGASFASQPDARNPEGAEEQPLSPPPPCWPDLLLPSSLEASGRARPWDPAAGFARLIENARDQRAAEGPVRSNCTPSG